MFLASTFLDSLFSLNPEPSLFRAYPFAPMPNRRTSLNSSSDVELGKKYRPAAYVGIWSKGQLNGVFPSLVYALKEST